jgi:hypothetical protein
VQIVKVSPFCCWEIAKCFSEPIFAVEWLGILFRVQEVPIYILAQRPAMGTEFFFCDFPQFLQAIDGRGPQVGNSFLPHTLKCIIGYSSQHSTLCSLNYWRLL